MPFHIDQLIHQRNYPQSEGWLRVSGVRTVDGHQEVKFQHSTVWFRAADYEGGTPPS